MTNGQSKNLLLVRLLIVGCSLILSSWYTIDCSYGQSSSREQTDDHQPMSDKMKTVLELTPPVTSLPEVKPAAKAGRIRQIHERIDLLKSIIEQDRKNTATKPMHRELPMKSIEKTNSPNQAPVNKSSMTMNESAEPKFVPSIDTDKLSATLPNVTDKPLDAVELAYSLYMTGNYSTAIKNLQAALKQEHTPDEAAWMNCLMGCCYRMQQKFDESEQLFRKSANQKSGAGISAKYSNWKLQYIESRKSAIQALRDIDTELKPYIQEAP